MKKIFSILTAAMFATLMMACGDKDATTDEDKNGGGEPIEQKSDYVPGGAYYYSVTDDENYLNDASYELVLLDDDNYFQYSISKHWADADNESFAKTYFGNYQYSNGTNKGTVELSLQKVGGGFEEAGKAEFTYNDGTITIKFLDETITLTKRL